MPELGNGWTVTIENPSLDVITTRPGLTHSNLVLIEGPPGPPGGVASVNDMQGAVTLTAADVGAETPAGAQTKADGAQAAAATDATNKVNAHAAVTATHGATGAVVGTTNTQTLTNKTLTAPVVDQFGAASGLGAAWANYTPTVTNLPCTITRARYKQIGKTVFAAIVLTATGAATGDIKVTLPVAVTAGDVTAKTILGSGWGFDASTGLLASSTGLAYPTSTTEFLTQQGGGNWSNGGPISGVASGDTFRWTLTYEAA